MRSVEPSAMARVKPSSITSRTAIGNARVAAAAMSRAPKASHKVPM